MKNLLMTAIAIFGLATISFGQTLPSYVPADGLVGWWPFNGNANDESGNGNDGTINGASITTDRFGNSGKAYSFNGINQWIEVQDNQSLDITQSITIAAWIYKPQFEQRYEAVLTKDFNGTNTQNINYKFQISEINGMMFFTSRGNTLCYFDTNAWHYFVGICTMDSIKIYLDNILLNSSYNQFNNNDLANTNLPLTIGRLSYSEPISVGNERMYFNGKIDDIGIWNRALSEVEISELYNAPNCSNNLSISPSSNQLQTGGIANFNATTSQPNPNYIWQSDLGQGFQTLNNYGNYSGVNTNSLSISNVQLPNHTQPIRVISTSGECIDTSNVATINITDTCILTINDTITTLISVTDTLVINTLITGLTPPNNSNTIKVFPNPANSHITIDFGNFASMNGYTLKITNSIGQIVFTTAINQQSSYVDLSTWGGNGIYFVQIIDTQNNTIENRKIVLQ